MEVITPSIILWEITVWAGHLPHPSSITFRLMVGALGAAEDDLGQ
jgi:hypothetical protein